jgi:hypothetical protein
MLQLRLMLFGKIGSKFGNGKDGFLPELPNSL